MESIMQNAALRASTATTRRWPQWMRDPLFHFLVIGAVLFALDAALVVRRDDPKTIVIGPQVEADARQLFQTMRGRAPDAQELRALRQVWLDNEVLYREGLALGLDKGDDTIRERVIFKSLSMVDNGTRLPSWDETTLRDWFEQNRQRYDQPARYDFQEAVLVGEASESEVRAFVQALNSGAAPDSQAGLRVFQTRPYPTIVQSYGDEAAQSLRALTPGQWQAVQTREGWRALQVTAVTPEKAADFALLRNMVLQDWTDAVMSEQRSAAVQAMARKYRVIEVAR